MEALLVDPPLEPGSSEWAREMTASKVAAVVGLSPWESPFSLWYQMAKGQANDPPSAEQARGHYLEDTVARWTAERFDLMLDLGRCWRNKERPWQVCTPDRLAVEPVGQEPGALYVPIAPVEVKTSASFETKAGLWGRDGTDEIPIYYRAQGVWQCDTLGLPRCFFGVLLTGLEFRGYIVEPQPGEAEWLRDQCRTFLDSVEVGQPPDCDGHDETYRVLRALHPQIEERSVDVPYALAADWANAVNDLREAEDNYALQRARMAVAMGTANKALYRDLTVARRSHNGRGNPFVVAPQKLPRFETAEEEPPEEDQDAG